MVVNLPTRKSIFRVLYDEVFCRDFLVKDGIIIETMSCADCSAIVRLNLTRWSYYHRCNGKQREISAFTRLFYFGSKLSCCEIMTISYNWLLGLGHTQIMADTGHASQTVTDFIKHLSQLVTDSIPEYDCVIGRLGIVVEIDESKLSKRKNNRRHRVNGVWVIGGVELTEQRRLFLVPVENRNASTIANVISQHVAAGSLIRTDCWGGYTFFDDREVYEHETVNHSKYYKDLSTKVHTNTIEGTWSAVKSMISKRYKTETCVGNYLFVFIWRRLNAGDLWKGILQCLRETLYL